MYTGSDPKCGGVDLQIRFSSSIFFQIIGDKLLGIKFFVLFGLHRLPEFEVVFRIPKFL